MTFFNIITIGLSTRDRIRCMGYIMSSWGVMLQFTIYLLLLPTLFLPSSSPSMTHV